ncbi:MAG: AAA family ATPase [bacterium]|nr:AAA family ATPase [bacterium]
MGTPFAPEVIVNTADKTPYEAAHSVINVLETGTNHYGVMSHGNSQPVNPEPITSPLYPAQFQSETTSDLPVLETIIGQERAVESIRFGVGIQHSGFNLFALGPNGIA